MHGIVAYTFLNICEKNSPVSIEPEKRTSFLLCTKENWGSFFLAHGEDRFIRFCRAHDHDTHTQRHTERPRYFACSYSNRPHICYAFASNAARPFIRYCKVL